MKLQFKHQPFQAEAVCDVFNGQPMRTTTYCLELGNMTDVQRDPNMTDTGFRNHSLVPELTNARILDNLSTVQRRGVLKPANTLARPGINPPYLLRWRQAPERPNLRTMYYTPVFYSLFMRRSFCASAPR